LVLVANAVPIYVQAKTHAPNHRLVVVISLDGFPAYALDDPRLPIPTLRKLMREGAAATSMQPINPTVTWPNHTAIVTGVNASEHHVLFNGLLIRPGDGTQPSIEPWRDKDLMVHSPTVYDIAFDTVGKSGFSRSLQSLKRGGFYVRVGGSGRLSSILWGIVQEKWASGTGAAKVIAVAIVVPVASDPEPETLGARYCRRCNRDGCQRGENVRHLPHVASPLVAQGKRLARPDVPGTGQELS